MTSYDADRPLDPEAWLLLDGHERRSLVRASHVGLSDTLHDSRVPPAMHAAMHVVIEDQIASGAPAVTRETVERLVDMGVRRHVALHMAIEVLMAQLAGGADVLDAPYAAALRALDPGTWLGDHMRRTLT